MRGERRRGASGEPCMLPLQGSMSSTSDKSLLADARRGDLHAMRKRMRSSIFRRPDDVNRRDERHCTPMHYAAKNGHLDMIKFLKEKGADVSATDKHGWNVLQYAVRYAPVEAAELLLDLGCDIAHREKKGWTCLHLAARNGQPEKARFLLERGADVHTVQNQGWNALHLAVRYGQPDTISTLLEHGIDINAANGGWTALHLAALNGHMDIASILLNKGSDTSARNGDGQSPLDIARNEGHDRIVAIILEREFQISQPEEVLPSPPPTPPSAPPMELFQSVDADLDDLDSDDENANNVSHDESFTEWRSRLCNALERAGDLRGGDGLGEGADGDGEDGEDRIATIDVRITWKTFEEEAKELMSQLERLRMQEVDKVKSQMLKTRREGKQKLDRLDRQAEVLRAQGTQLEESIPGIRRKFADLIAGEYRNLEDLRGMVVTAEKEQDLFAALNAGLLRDSPAVSNAGKLKALEEFGRLQAKEREELSAQESQLLGNIERLGAKRESEVAVAKEKIRILGESVSSLRRRRAEQEGENARLLEELSEQLEKAERKSAVQLANAANQEGANGCSGGDMNKEEHWFGCPVCLTLLKPPMRIFQCPEGHILCEECKENPAMVHCPQCRCPLEGQCSRNRALEEVARSYFPMAPSETL